VRRQHVPEELHVHSDRSRFNGLAVAMLSAPRISSRLPAHTRFKWQRGPDELVQTGAYRLCGIRYLLMLCMLSMSIAVVGTLPRWPFAVALGIAGTEIRVRVEDGLLRERFGSKFTEWQKRVPAYLPLVR